MNISTTARLNDLAATRLVGALAFSIGLNCCSGKIVSVGEAGDPLMTTSAEGGMTSDRQVPDYYPEYTKGPYGFCEASPFPLPRAYCPGGHALSTSIQVPDTPPFAGPGANVVECFCQLDCEKSSDCPDPGSGTSQPSCSGKVCVLPCDTDSECPTGMLCSELESPSSKAGKTCKWSSLQEDQAAPPDCSALTTKAACQDYLTNNVFRPTQGCVWVQESIYSDSNDACEPVVSEGKCLLGERMQDCNPDAGPVFSCGAGQPWVHWKDWGAGTSALLETDPCLIPATINPDINGVTLGACQPGDPPLPLLCDCACQGG